MLGVCHSSNGHRLTPATLPCFATASSQRNATDELETQCDVAFTAAGYQIGTGTERDKVAAIRYCAH